MVLLFVQYKYLLDIVLQRKKQESSSYLVYFWLQNFFLLSPLQNNQKVKNHHILRFVKITSLLNRKSIRSGFFQATFHEVCRYLLFLMWNNILENGSLFYSLFVCLFLIDSTGTLYTDIKRIDKYVFDSETFTGNLDSIWCMDGSWWVFLLLLISFGKRIFIY